jgi:hypothetical protein
LLPKLSSHFPGVEIATLESAVAQTLCDPKAFSQAGCDFFKKLNTLHKAIRAGRWQAPSLIQESAQQQAAQEQQKHTVSLQTRQRELQGEYQQLLAMAASLRKRGEIQLSTEIEKQGEQCQERLQALHHASQVSKGVGGQCADSVPNVSESQNTLPQQPSQHPSVFEITTGKNQ